MAKFRKKPVAIEAEQFLASVESFDKIKKMGLRNFKPGPMGGNSFKIPTLEGDMNVSEGDWVIKGVNGEFYPCKPDIFEKTYEPVEG